MDRYRLRQDFATKDQMFPAGTVFTEDTADRRIGQPIDPAFPEQRLYPLTPEVPLKFCDKL
jgi:hypothetical protein